MCGVKILHFRATWSTVTRPLHLGYRQNHKTRKNEQTITWLSSLRSERVFYSVVAKQHPPQQSDSNSSSAGWGGRHRKKKSEPADRRRIHRQSHVVHLGPRGHHECLPLPRQLLPQCLRNEGHEGVQQSQARVKHVHQCSPCAVGPCIGSLAVSRGEGADSSLACLYVPSRISRK